MVYSKQNLFLLATVVLAFTAFCVETDVYTPSFPEMVIYFDISESRIQHVLTANFIGLFVSTLIFGPLSDSFGRKTLLSVGLSLFALSSVVCMVVTSIEQLIIWRFIQGVGAGAITGIGTAMIFDVFSKETSARLISVLNSFVAGMMALAPIVGSWINILFGWRMNFALIALLAILSLLATVFLVKESHPPLKRLPLNYKGILNEYGAMLKNVTFICNTMIWTLMFGLLMVFIANLSLIYIDHLNVPERAFGFYQASIMFAFFMASLGGAQCIAHIGMEQTKRLGNLLFGLGALGLIVLITFNIISPWLLTLLMCFCSAGVALSCAIYYVYAMADFPHAIGTLAALSQALRLLICASMIAISSMLFNGTMKPLGYITTAVIILSTIMYLMATKASIRRDPNNYQTTN